ncbi:hypothetical protein BDQ17DRAFT_1349254 [Cyathus striatus]|nr:hypothetical protein BDQ17DRAFT_1349254 [Cyathus striatus]
MSHRYAPLANDPRTDRHMHRDQQVEMEAAFDYSDDEDDNSESTPLNPSSTPPPSYDFENLDYASYPPPGSPPTPSARALPNDIGNSNGLVPSFDHTSNPAARSEQPWINTTLPQGPVGGGTRNDGVFANVTAKPTRPLRIHDGDDTYIVPEDAAREAPPSYASAQADAVPPYWETTVHAPFSPDSVGEMIIDSLPTGSLFTFVWNMAVSVSFQFIGFLLTYLMHSSHAARLGSRAGLGITLINYGFALRARLDSSEGASGDSSTWGDSWKPDAAPHPTFSTAAEADAWYSHNASVDNSTSTFPNGMTEDQANMLVADATAEWLSFFLMTMGWFILLTSLLGFWRVKRWERSVLASQQSSSGTAPSVQPTRSFTSRVEQLFALRGVSRSDFFRQGFGLGRRNEANEDEDVRQIVRAEEGEASPVDARETDFMISPDTNDPERAHAVQRVLQNERRLQDDLRSAGLL